MIDSKNALHLMRLHAQQMGSNGRPIRCPVCQGEQLTFTGIEAAFQQASEDGPVPVVVVVCDNCFFTMHFSWNGLKARYGGGAG